MKLTKTIKQLNKKDWLIIFFELVGLAFLILLGVLFWSFINSENWDF